MDNLPRDNLDLFEVNFISRVHLVSYFDLESVPEIILDFNSCFVHEAS